MAYRFVRGSLLALFALLAACSSRPVDLDASMGPLGVGARCVTTTECRSGLVCDPESRTCQGAASTPAGMPCTLTADCASGLFCAATGRCAPAGDVEVGGTCTDTSSCVRGAVCVRDAPGLYGVCEAPRGSTVAGGDAGAGDAGGDGGTARDLNGGCQDVLDCLAGLACSPSTHTCQPGVPGEGLPALWTGERCESEPATVDGGAAPVRAYFEVPALDGTPRHDFFRLPFPNDARRDPSTGRINLTGFPHPGTSAVGFDAVDRYARASEQDLDGFGTNQIVYFRFSGGIDFGTLRLGDSVQLVDLTAGAPTSSIAFGADTGGNRYLCPNYVTVDTGRGMPMRPGHTYAALLTDGIHDTHGAPARADADFTAMLAASAPADPALARAWTAYAPLRAYLAAHPLAGGAALIDAAVFTTQDPLRVVPALRDAVRAMPAPTASGFVRCDTGVTSPCDDGLTGDAHVRGCIGAADPAFDELQGRIEVPVFQQGTRPYRTPGEGAIVLDGAGHATAQGTERVCVTVTVPRGVSAPAGGWPVVLYAHGTGGTYRSVVSEGLARALSSVDLGGGATAHLATVGFEGVMHGERRGAGVTDSPDVLFFDFANPQAARDNVLQGAADVFAMVRALETVQLAMLPAPSDAVAFDPRAILFLGHSQGSTVGTAAVAYEPDLAGVVLSGAGGDLRASLTTKRHPVDIASLVPLALQEPGADASHPALNLFQAFFERSDAVNYGPRVLFDRPAGVPLRPVVQTYGLGDTYSTVQTMQALATAVGLPAAAPIPGGMDAWPSGAGVALPLTNNVSAAGGATTAALLEVDPMGAYDGHFVLFRDSALEQRVARFLATCAAGSAVVQ